jgi:hypothetical protein
MLAAASGSFIHTRGLGIYRSLIAPRGSSIGLKVKIPQLRGCARAHGELFYGNTREFVEVL